MATGPARATRTRGARPGLPLKVRAAEVIEEQRSRMADNLGSAVDGRDPEGVHDMRVASRRLRAVLQVFGPWLDPGEVERLGSAARRVTRALGPVREIDVMRIALRALQGRAQPLRAFAIEQVDARLATDRRRARARMMKRFARVDLEELDERLRHLVAGLRHASAPANGAAGAPVPSGEAPSVGEPTMLDLMRSLAPEVILHARRIVAEELGAEIGSAADREALHEIRIEAKKLRYTVEILAPDLGTSGKKLVRRLRRLQDRLGDFHDDVVLDATLGEAIERAHRDDCGRLATELARLRAARRRSLLAAERGCRREIELLRGEGFAESVAEALVGAGAISRAAVSGAPQAGPEQGASRPPAREVEDDESSEHGHAGGAHGTPSARDARGANEREEPRESEGDAAGAAHSASQERMR